MKKMKDDKKTIFLGVAFDFLEDCPNVGMQKLQVFLKIS